MYTLLSYLLLTFSCSLIQLSTFSEAKIPTDGLTVDLIHRYSPQSPFYNSSMTLQERSQGLARHSASRYRHLKFRKRKSINYDTDLLPYDGDYLMKISVGEPPIDLSVIVDTGSDLIWIQCKPCQDCYSQKAPMFDPNRSSTFQIVPCDSPFCSDSFQTNCSSGECEYWYAYGDGSSWTEGIMVEDILTVASKHNSQQHITSSIVFGCGSAQEGDFDENMDGLIGLGGGPLSLISQLGSSISKTFSYCLNPSPSNLTSRLTLGSNNAARTRIGAVETPLLSQDMSDDTFYSIRLEAISVGQNRVEVDKDIIIDNGSTLTYLDTDTYSNLEQTLRNAVTDKPVAEPDPEFDLCYDKKSGFTAPDNIVFHLTGGDILLNTTNYLMDLGDTVCLAIVSSGVEDDDFMIMGNVAQVNFEVEFNLGRKMVSFAPTDCALSSQPTAD